MYLTVRSKRWLQPLSNVIDKNELNTAGDIRLRQKQLHQLPVSNLTAVICAEITYIRVVCLIIGNIPTTDEAQELRVKRPPFAVYVAAYYCSVFRSKSIIVICSSCKFNERKKWMDFKIYVK